MEIRCTERGEVVRPLTQARIRSGLFRVRASLRARARYLPLAISPAGFTVHDTRSPAGFSSWVERVPARRSGSLPDSWRTRMDLPLASPSRLQPSRRARASQPRFSTTFESSGLTTASVCAPPVREPGTVSGHPAPGQGDLHGSLCSEAGGHCPRSCVPRPRRDEPAAARGFERCPGRDDHELPAAATAGDVPASDRGFEGRMAKHLPWRSRGNWTVAAASSGPARLSAPIRGGGPQGGDHR
jgi:hypothetical protein